LDAKIIDGKELAASIREELKKRVEVLNDQKGITPGLAVILVGDDPASHSYVNNKEKACLEVGIDSQIFRLPAQTAEAEIISIIEKLNSDTQVDGILVQLPLPGHIDTLRVLHKVDAKKDVDGTHVETAGKLMVGEKGFLPCTPKGIIRMIKSTGMEISGKNAVVVGRSNIVGKPVALLLLRENATVTICHSKTADLKKICAGADILIVAIGQPCFIKGDFIKNGAVVIDVGSTMVDGKWKGDVQFEEAYQKASYITPVPGGVGPMTITMLMENTVEAGEIYG
jgi:methylenetetrahydrofolate dehydrogenase (NADP+)/methenyltetrahydrofolate cyclohydrolase